VLGAIAGDVIGSIYEFDNIKSKSFTLIDPTCHFTDDSVLTVALAESLLSGEDFAVLMRRYYRRYPRAGYGLGFHRWAASEASGPYNSWGNGAAMRISPVGHAFDSLEETLRQAALFTAVTHNHPEGIKGAQATAAAIFLGRHGSSKADIRSFIQEQFDYDLSATLDSIRPDYRFDESCQGTVPQALIAFLESVDFEDAIRNAVSLGGDTDTLACITGGVAEAFYGGVPEHIAGPILATLDVPLREITMKFMADHPPRACGGTPPPAHLNP
jgi:ADP-ribosylglycohydrolase